MRIHQHPEYGFLEIYLPMTVERLSPTQARNVAARLLRAANELDQQMRLIEDEWVEIHGHEVIYGDDLPATPLPDSRPKKAPGRGKT